MSDANKKVNVAIIDSGIDGSHPRVGYVAGGVRISVHSTGHVFYSDEHSDCAGHGTACAGIIRKKAPNAELYSVRIFDETLTADGRALIAAIEWCIEQGMHVVNLSLGTTDVTFKKPLHAICQKAQKAGIILVAAESNDGRESYPAVFPEVIGVTGGAMAEGYIYRRRHPIECIARGDEQRLCWLNGKYIIAGGNSFAAPHIAGITALLRADHPNISTQRFREILFQNAIEQQNAPVSMPDATQKPRAEGSNPYPWIQKAALYPYNKEMHSLVRYRDLLAFALVGIADPVGKGLVGKDAGEAIGEAHAGLRIRPRIHDAMADAGTLILGYVDQLARIHKRDLLRECVQTALDRGLNVFSFQELPTQHYADLHDLAAKKNLRIAYPHIRQEDIIHALRNPNEHPPVDVPVLAVMGTSSQQGKFTLQLALRRRLIQMGYRVGQLGTEHHAELFGMDAAFPMGYASPLKLPLQTYVPYLDHTMRAMCQSKRPHIILSGSQSGAIPYDVSEHITHSLPSLAFLLGVKPDACVLVVNSIDPDAYIRDTLDGLRAIGKAPVLALALSNIKKHIRTAYGRSFVTPQPLMPDEIAHHLKHLEKTFHLPAVEILSPDGQQRLINAILTHFAEDRSAA